MFDFSESFGTVDMNYLMCIPVNVKHMLKGKCIHKNTQTGYSVRLTQLANIVLEQTIRSFKYPIMYSSKIFEKLVRIYFLQKLIKEIIIIYIQLFGS